MQIEKLRNATRKEESSAIVSQTLRVLSLSARARAPLCEEELAPFLFFLEREVREKRDASEKKNAF